MPRRRGKGWSDSPELSVVVPVHNERENVGEVESRTARAVASTGLSFELLFVDDGSTDGTAELIDDLARRDPRVGVVTLSRNFGHQAAVSAGLEHARGRAVVVMDGDLQDPPELIPALVAAWREGYEVAYAVRRSRQGSVALRGSYWLFYRVLRAVSDLRIPLDSGDFGLMDRRVVDALNDLPERLRFVRGLRTFVGFRQVGIPFDRPDRAAGMAKYRLRSLVRLAVNGLISFSGYPLRLVTYLGLVVAAVAVGLTAWVLRDALVYQTAPRGWASLLLVVLVLGALQMLSLGVIGEYVHGTFLEAKRRPSYIVRGYRPSGGSAGEVEPGPLRRFLRHPAHTWAKPLHRPMIRRLTARPRHFS
jgi:dolichol-phosphate mannosyltransferase